MKLELNGQTVYASTGGRDFDASSKVVVLLHGSGQSHLSWVLQGRYLAYDGYSILAPDLPGHGLSGGAPLTSIEDMAEWVVGLLDALGVKTATLVGHSQGVLVALSAIANHPDRFDKVALIAGALAIPVNAQLVQDSQTALETAIENMTSWGHGQIAQMHDHSQPGHSFLFYGRQLMAANNRQALLADFNACNAYQSGAVDAARITIPALVVLAGKDRMTPIRTGRELAGTIKDVKLVEVADAGHMLPAEAPDAVNDELVAFLGS